MAAPLPALSLLETRVLGVLVEKQHTVPDTYPLTLNALVSGCNQKTSRYPILEATEAEVQATLDHLKSLSLVVESSGGRVMRYAHNAGRVLGLPPQSVALLATLMLRGPLPAVEAFLEELAARPDGARVVELARQPGTRETRWAHLLSGPPDEAAAPAPASVSGAEAPSLGEIAALKANVDRLEAEVAEIRDKLASVCRELGL